MSDTDKEIAAITQRMRAVNDATAALGCTTLATRTPNVCGG